QAARVHFLFGRSWTEASRERELLRGFRGPPLLCRRRLVRAIVGRRLRLLYRPVELLVEVRRHGMAITMPKAVFSNLCQMPTAKHLTSLQIHYMKHGDEPEHGAGKPRRGVSWPRFEETA